MSAKPTKSKRSAKAGVGTEDDTVRKSKAANAKTAADKGSKRKGTAAKAGRAGPASDGTTASKSAPESRDGEATGAAAEAASALNDPVTFLNFVANHPVGSTFDGTVVSFTSHGAHIDVGGMLCHVPLRGLSDPPPTRARQVLAKGETRPFVLVSLDAARRRAALALPGIAPG